MKLAETKKVQSHFDMEGLVGYILLVGVLLSVLFLGVGLIWHWASAGKLGLDYPIGGRNLFGFLLLLSEQMISGTFHPRLLVSLGIATLLLTPLVRVIASMFYFAVIEHNGKYTAFTGFVTVVLAYSLFLR
jgi:uncharacterized membrane protein